ncbi:MAG: LysR family transcriptional regulator [Gammaproteobacteria bacterium]|nr:LysR family transcriptional regulator [Gammaproteobacteria bacterium]
MSRLNYHHLYYFWCVARDGNLTRTATRLHVSQSALSMQIRQLEEMTGHGLFNRTGRRLVLTETGQIVLRYANGIFRQGEELETFLRDGLQSQRQRLRIGVVSTLSRNFADSFLAPLLPQANITLELQSARLDDLLNRLSTHALDIVLSNVNVLSSVDELWLSQLLARQPVSVIGPAAGALHGKQFPHDYSSFRWLLPSSKSEVRSAFDALCSQWQFEPDVLAEVDDMAMLRLLARDSGALAVMPKVVVRDEIARGELCEYTQLPNVFEQFFAITIKKQYQPSALSSLLEQQQSMSLEA